MPFAAASARLSGSGGPRRRAEALPLALLLVVAALLCGPALVGRGALLPLDLLGQAEPWRSELPGLPDAPPANPEMSDAVWEVLPLTLRALASWREGVPLWDPLPMNGVPALAAGKLYLHPILLPAAALLGPVTGLAWTAFAHLVLAGWGVYFLLRQLACRPLAALLGALCFELGGYLVAWLELPFVAGTLAWTPWIFWGIERAIARRDLRPAALAALAFAAQISSGYVLGAYLGAAGAGALFLGRASALARPLGLAVAARRVLAPLAVALLGGSALAAVQLLPTLELYGESVRSDASATVSTLPAREALRLLAPHLQGRPLAGDRFTGVGHYPDSALYLGILPLAGFAAALLRRRAPGALGYPLLALLPALAVFGVPPFLALMELAAPMLRQAAAPRLFGLVAFAAAVAVGLGTEALLAARQEHPEARRARRIGIALLSGLAGLAVAVRATARWPAGDWMVHPRHLWLTALLCGAGVVLLRLRQRELLSARALGLLFVALTTADLLRASAGWNGRHDSRLALPETPSLAALSALVAAGDPAAEPRVLAVHSNSILPGRTAERFGLAVPTGYSSWVLRRTSRYADLAGDRPAVSINHLYYATCCAPLSDALGLAHILVDRGTVGALDPERDLLVRLPQATIRAEIPPGRRVWEIDGVERPVLFAHAPAELRFRLGEGAGRRFRSAIALDAAAIDCPTDGARFLVRALGPDGRDQLLFSRYLDPVRRPEDRGAHPVELALDEVAPGARELVLETRAGPRRDLTCDWTGWVAPRLESAAPDPLERLRGGPNPIYRNREAFPRAWLVHAAESVATGDLEGAGRHLLARQHELARWAVVEHPRGLALAPASGPESVRWELATSSRLVLTVEASAAALLVLSDSYYPGWRASVDGVERPVLATNLAMRGVELSAGRHRVELAFRPWSHRVGLATSGLSALLLGLAWPRFRRSAGAAGP